VGGAAAARDLIPGAEAWVDNIEFVEIGQPGDGTEK
jgi:hypothetical protein